MEYIVRIPFEALCCLAEFVPRDKLILHEQTSKNRLQIQLGIGYHNVKKSTFFRCCREVNNAELLLSV